MPRIVIYVQTAFIIALTVFGFLMSADNAELTESLELCGKARDTANINLVLARSSVSYQNSRVRQAEHQAIQMRQRGALAEAEAAREIELLQHRIAELRRAPKATTCEAVRVKMLRNVGVQL